MLPALIYFVVFLFLNLPAVAEEKVMDLSWIKNLNRQAESLAQTQQTEAQTIVDHARKTSTQPKRCKVADILARHAEQSARKSLDITHDEENNRYPELLVFVSFSVPLETLKTLTTQVNHAGGKVVFRGLVNGSFRQTAEKVKELQQEVLIDPTLFEEYQIEVVPTFVLQNNTTKKGTEVSYDLLAGNVSLEYALDQFASHRTTTPKASELLKKLRKEP